MSSKNQRNITLETEITALLRQRDKRAISLLYENYSGALYGIIARTIPSEEVAQEVLQDVFVKVWKNADKYDATKGRLFTWLAQITRNATTDTFRSGKYQRSTKTDEIDVTVSNHEAFSETSNIKDVGLKKVIDSLDEKYRILIDYIYFRGYSQADAAKELDIPLGTVKTRVRAAILELRKTLGNELFNLLVLLAFLLSLLCVV